MEVRNDGVVIFLQKYIVVLLLLTCMILAGCNYSENNIKDDEVLSNIDIYDFYYIKKAPVATKKHDLNEIIKISFTTTSPIPTRIAIDIKNNEFYKNPNHLTNGVDTLDGTIYFDDKSTLLNILEKYSIQEWKEDYTTEDSDTYQYGYGWNLLLQFEDGTVERHRGQGSTVDIFPEGFEGFVREIDQLAKEILGEDYMKDSYNEP